jgi:hypothetical protein
MTNEQRVALEPTVERLRHLLATLHRRFPEAWKQFDMFRAAKGSTIAKWPDWCFCPMTFACAIVAENGGDPIEQFGLAGLLAATAAWRVGQGVYVFDETVLQDLWGQPINGEIPSEVLLRLPESGMYVAFPEPMIVHDGGEPHTVFGFFAHLDYDPETQTRALRIVADTPDGFMQTVPIDLVGTLDDSMKSVMAESVRQISGGAAAPEVVDDLVAGVTAENSEIAQQARAVREPFLSVCLYLCADNAEIEGTGSRRRPVLVKTRNGPRMMTPNAPTFWEVAYRTGAALRRALEDEAIQYVPKGGSHAAPRPHTRRAHWHHYWTGPKAKLGAAQPTERVLVLKWIPQLKINVDDDRTVIPTIHEVQ